MTDNVGYTPGVGARVATREVTYSGEAANLQVVGLATVSGPDDGKTVADISTSNPLPVAIQGTPSLPTGAATEATLSAVNNKIADLATRPLDNASPGQPVRQIGQEVWNVSFADSGSSVLSSDFTAPIVGAGVTYNQATSSLNVLTGVNTNSEFLTRSVVAWRGAMRLKFSIVASQRIANQNFAILLADLIGENLSYTINSATSVTVNVPGHTFTAATVGQSIHLAGITGAAGVPGRYAIASVVVGTSITFTVAGWPASGTGTLTLMGHSYVRNLFTGVTATNVSFDAQRRGWATGDTTATINTTAAPGTVIHSELTGRECFMMDQLRASSGAPNVATRASRVENIPDDNLDLYVWIWNFNGTTAPASTTTFTVGFISVEKFANTPVYVQGFRALGNTNAPFVNITGNPNVVGNAAEDAVVTGNPVRIGARAYDTLPAFTIVNGDVIDIRASRSGQIVFKQFAPGELDFTVNATVTTAVQTALRAAQAANIRSNITAITYQNTSATPATLTIQDGASTVLISWSVPATMAEPRQLLFPTPLRGSAATAVNYTASAAANIILNVTGYNSY